MTINTGSARLPTPSEFRIYVVIQHTPVNTKHNSLSLIKIHRKTLTWFTVSQCDAVCCSITAMPKAMRSSDNCNLQWGMRKGGGREWRERRKQWVEIKSTAADSEKQWQWICLHSMLSLLLTLTTLWIVIKTQAYQIIDPEWKEDGVEVACDEVTHASNNLFTTFILIAEISYLSACFITEMCTAEHRSSPATTHPTTGNRWHTKSQLMPLTLCYTAQAQRYMCSIPL